MKIKQIKQCVIIGAIALMALYFATSAIASQEKAAQDRPAAQGEKNAEEVYKNVQVLKGVPARRFIGMMRTFARSLGVECSFCHVQGAFDSDEKPQKQTARKMIQIVHVANRELGADKVSCYTCHRGHEEPERMPEALRPTEEQRQKAAQDTRPAEEAFKNIQSFKGRTAGQLLLAMSSFTKALGVDCNYCHVAGAFDKDDKPAKLMARKMLAMSGAITKEVFNGKGGIGCYTCHKGQTQPVSTPPAPSDAEKKSDD
ncbi:MAG TPA: c-type cytochrome [Blastocatellia bacterium]|nr:c-type cytochrome [Blastocatellia bacterium]